MQRPIHRFGCRGHSVKQFQDALDRVISWRFCPNITATVNANWHPTLISPNKWFRIRQLEHHLPAFAFTETNSTKRNLATYMLMRKNTKSKQKTSSWIESRVGNVFPIIIQFGRSLHHYLFYDVFVVPIEIYLYGGTSQFAGSSCPVPYSLRYLMGSSAYHPISRGKLLWLLLCTVRL